jgi:hypothetical protein
MEVPPDSSAAKSNSQIFMPVMPCSSRLSASLVGPVEERIQVLIRPLGARPRQPQSWVSWPKLPRTYP